MPITKRNVLKHELIGLDATVSNSSDPILIGIRGKIVDETRDTLVIEHAGKLKVVPKATSVFTLVLPSGEKVEVNGGRLIARPEERVKRG